MLGSTEVVHQCVCAWILYLEVIFSKQYLSEKKEAKKHSCSR